MSELKTMAKKMPMKWVIIRAQANRERSVSEKIIKESQKGILADKIGQVIVPMEKSFFLKNNKKIVREKVMYPGYIFVETSSIDDLKFYVKNCDGATGFLSKRDGEIQILRNSEVDSMIGRQKEINDKKEINYKFIPGEEVKIIDGPFSTFTGIVESSYDSKLKVSVSIFGRKSIVDLNMSQVDKI